MSVIKNLRYENGTKEVFRLVVEDSAYAGTYDIEMPDKFELKRDKQKNDGLPNGSKPQSARQASQPEQGRIRRRNRGVSDVADWRGATPEKVVSAIAAVTSHGCAIRFGYTRDGGAYAVGIIGDGEPFTEFIRPTEDVDLYLDSLASDYSRSGE